MKLNWTEPALEDLEAIQAYIAKDSRFYAHSVIERIFDAAKKLETFPEIGRRVPEAEERLDVRELIFLSYRIISWIQLRSAILVFTRLLAMCQQKIPYEVF